MAENPTAGLTQEEDEEEVDYDSDGNPIAPTTKKIIMPLPPIDHSEVPLLRFPTVIVALMSLKGSYNAISSFPFSFGCYKLFVHR